MKRSQINRTLREALALFARHHFALPPWATWSPETWATEPEAAAYCGRRQMGWDVTDFGAGRFADRGLLLFCVRNGVAGAANERPYAEKAMMVGEGQETPFHYHKVKMEDIIVRGGGNLVVELRRSSTVSANPIEVVVDNVSRRVAADEPIVLAPGQSITLPRGLAHRFYGEPGRGTVFVGEVSQVNDDHTDNYFLEPVSRFGEDLVEDEPPLYPLWTDL